VEPIQTSLDLDVLFQSLPLTSDDESPTLSSTKLPSYFMKKVAESMKMATALSCTTLKKEFQSPKISPSGTPIKIDADMSSTELSDEFSKPEQIKPNDYIQIAHLKAQSWEYTNIFSAFPKTHIEGHTYIIELNDKVLNEKSLKDLRDNLQYSLTGGGGPKVKDNIPFFAAEEEKVCMAIHSRQCAGIQTHLEKF
jgi:hypothetical protein